MCTKCICSLLHNLHTQLPWWQMQLHTMFLQLHAQIGKWYSARDFDVALSIYLAREDFRNEVSVCECNKQTFL